MTEEPRRDRIGRAEISQRTPFASQKVFRLNPQNAYAAQHCYDAPAGDTS
jgi:hypothetical protein